MEIRHPWKTDVILDPEPKMVEKLTQLMPDSPIIASGNLQEQCLRNGRT
jgi:hypothetical protein